VLNKQNGELNGNSKEWKIRDDKVREGNQTEENDSSYIAKKRWKDYSPVTGSNINHYAKQGC